MVIKKRVMCTLLIVLLVMLPVAQAGCITLSDLQEQFKNNFYEQFNREPSAEELAEGIQYTYQALIKKISSEEISIAVLNAINAIPSITSSEKAEMLFTATQGILNLKDTSVELSPELIVRLFENVHNNNELQNNINKILIEEKKTFETKIKHNAIKQVAQKTAEEILNQLVNKENVAEQEAISNAYSGRVEKVKSYVKSYLASEDAPSRKQRIALAQALVKSRKSPLTITIDLKKAILAAHDIEPNEEEIVANLAKKDKNDPTFDPLFGQIDHISSFQLHAKGRILLEAFRQAYRDLDFSEEDAQVNAKADAQLILDAGVVVKGDEVLSLAKKMARKKPDLAKSYILRSKYVSESELNEFILVGTSLEDIISDAVTGKILYSIIAKDYDKIKSQIPKYKIKGVLDKEEGIQKDGFSPHATEHSPKEERDSVRATGPEMTYQADFKKFIIKDGLFYDEEGNFANTKYGIWVLSVDGKFIASERSENFPHPHLVRGRNVLGAGEIDIVDGKIDYIDPKTGHYYPQNQVLQYGFESKVINSFLSAEERYQFEFTDDAVVSTERDNRKKC